MKYPKLATAAIIIKLDKVLLAKLASGPEAGSWVLPGGRAGFKKTADPEQAVKMEISSFLGTEFRIDYFFKHYVYKDDGDVYLYFIYVGRLAAEELKADPGQVADFKFFPEDEIAELNIAYGHEQVIDDFLYQ